MYNILSGNSLVDIGAGVRYEISMNYFTAGIGFRIFSVGD